MRISKADLGERQELDIYVNGQKLKALLCSELSTTIISVDHLDLVEPVPGGVYRYGKILGKAYAIISLTDQTLDGKKIPVEIAPLLDVAVLLGRDVTEP